MRLLTTLRPRASRLPWLAAVLTAACTSDPATGTTDAARDDVAVDAMTADAPTLDDRAPTGDAVDAPIPTDVAPLTDVATPTDVADAGDPDAPAPMCPAGQTRCGADCVDTRTNNGHCGRCDNVCAPTERCAEGACGTAMACPDAQTLCAGACVDTGTSAANCGLCGNACAAGQLCLGGACAAPMTCTLGLTACGDGCVDTQTDPTHCGRCGSACAMGQSCVAGVCAAPTSCAAGQTRCAGVCVNTADDLANCGMCGRACAADQRCVAGACAMTACPTGQTSCGGACVDLQTSAGNCGGCGRACAAGQTCAAGVCAGAVSCAGGETRCGEACANTMTDPSNCGMCGRACDAGQSCAAGVCNTATVGCTTPGQTLCGTSCVNTDSDARNCGRCGNACPAGQTCAGGSCACVGTILCGGSCVDPQTSAAHCGACGNACPSGQSCAAGRCVCPGGATACGSACTNTATDAANCGVCGNACPSGQVCAAGRCGCATGLSLCGSACVNTQTATAHCGACMRACTLGQTCSTGSCTCPPPNLMCGSLCTDPRADAANCGRCGNACPRGETCSAGVCRAVAGPRNDERAGATAIDLSRPTADLLADTTLARNEARGPCSCTSGADVFYTFTLTQPEIVYADTLGATWNTSLYFLNAAGAAVADAGTSGGQTCNDDDGFCGTGRQSQIVARLPAGTWYLVLSGCERGTATVHFQHLPAGNGPSARVTPTSTPQMLSGVTAGTGTVSSTCCSGGPENSYWFVTCGGGGTVQFHATTCGLSSINTVLDQRSALRTPGALCNDDVGSSFACGARSAINTQIPRDAGLHTLLVDSCAGAGAYGVNISLSNCAAGLTWCGACTNPLTDRNHCGGCNRQCAAGNNCVSGTCVAAPANDTLANATNLVLSAASIVVLGDTTGASHDAIGLCGCTTTAPDVWYRFTLAGTEYIYADTIGATGDTALHLTNATGAPVLTADLTNGQTCNDNDGLFGCATGRQSQILAKLTPGTYHLVLSGCSRGTANVRFQHLPTGSGSTRFLPQTTSQVFLGVTTGAGTVRGACCSSGPEDSLYWYTCGSSPGGAFTASTCGRATWDTTLDERSAGRPAVSVCAEDTCGRRSALATTIAAGPGLHALYIDGCNDNVGSGVYSVVVSRP